MMINAAYCREMARYNAWQNTQLSEAVAAMAPDDLTRDRGAFFGSILGTLNHLLWGDHIWMSRFDGGTAPQGGIPESWTRHATVQGWLRERPLMDDRISDWARAVTDDDLAGDLTWYSGATGRDQSKPLALCVVGFFNHQTHHRGQVHAMLTAADSNAPVTDLVFMPEDM